MFVVTTEVTNEFKSCMLLIGNINLNKEGTPLPRFLFESYMCNMSILSQLNHLWSTSFSFLEHDIFRHHLTVNEDKHKIEICFHRKM